MPRYGMNLLVSLIAACYMQNVFSAKKPMYKVTTILVNPFMMMKETRHTSILQGNDRFYGFIKDLLEKVSVFVGFDYELHVVKDKTYGTYNKTTGKWNGMIGELQDDKTGAHIAAAPLTVTSQREDVVEFSKPFYTFGITVIMKKPGAFELEVLQKMFQTINPFSVVVWIMVLVALVVTSAVLYIFGRVNPYDWNIMAKHGMASKVEKDNFSLSNSILFAISTLLWQGYTRAPRSCASRIVVIGWWVFTALILLTYTASLVAHFLVNKDTGGHPAINSFNDLEKNSKVKFGTLTSGSTEVFFINSKIPTYARMGDRMRLSKEPPITKTADGIRKVRNSNGEYAFILESSMAKHFVAQPPCDLVMLEQRVSTSSYAFAGKKNMPMISDISKALLSLYESGQLALLDDKWFKSNCAGTTIDSGTKVSMDSSRGSSSMETQFRKKTVQIEDVAASFVILLFALFMGVLVCIVEKCVYKRKPISAKSFRFEDDDEEDKELRFRDNGGLHVTSEHLSSL